MLRPEYLSKKLTPPIPTKDGGTPRTIQDACDYMAAIGKEHVGLHRPVLNDRRPVLHGPDDNSGWRVAFRRARPVFAEYATARRVTVGDADQASFNPPGLVFGIGTRR